jgi:hypothetical protein
VIGDLVGEIAALDASLEEREAAADVRFQERLEAYYGWRADPHAGIFSPPLGPLMAGVERDEAKRRARAEYRDKRDALRQRDDPPLPPP